MIKFKKKSTAAKLARLLNVKFSAPIVLMVDYEKSTTEEREVANIRLHQYVSRLQ
jgi:hypothetical protein